MFRPYETYKRLGLYGEEIHDKRLGECGETRLKSVPARAADGRDLKE